jgi:hypothetical protein
MRAATEVYQWRDQPFEGARPFPAQNSPVGALITYSLGEPVHGDSAAVARIVVTTHDGALVRELAGPATPGLHRVRWDLHTEFPFAPTADDSGYYGAPVAPYVPPGAYTVTISARGTTASQTVQVRADSSALSTPEASAARQRFIVRVDTLSRAFRDGKRALAELDTEFTNMKPLLEHPPRSPATDSAIKRVEKQLRGLHESFAEEYGGPIGNAFDLLGGIEGSSSAPTQAEERMLDLAATQLRDAIAKLNDAIKTSMPELRLALKQQAPRAIAPVRPPQ